MSIVLLSAEATGNPAIIITTEYSANSSACIRIMLPELLQLSNCMTAVMRLRAFAVKSSMLLHICLVACQNEALLS